MFLCAVGKCQGAGELSVLRHLTILGWQGPAVLAAGVWDEGAVLYVFFNSHLSTGILFHSFSLSLWEDNST